MVHIIGITTRLDTLLGKIQKIIPNIYVNKVYCFYLLRAGLEGLESNDNGSAHGKKNNRSEQYG
jgi:hypothetical protein